MFSESEARSHQQPGPGRIHWSRSSEWGCGQWPALRPTVTMWRAWEGKWEWSASWSPGPARSMVMSNGDVICTCSGEHFCVCRALRAKAQLRGKQAKLCCLAWLSKGFGHGQEAISCQNAKQARVGRKRRIDAYEFGRSSRWSRGGTPVHSNRLAIVFVQNIYCSIRRTSLPKTFNSGPSLSSRSLRCTKRFMGLAHTPFQLQ